jgi:hypothetical protein
LLAGEDLELLIRDFAMGRFPMMNGSLESTVTDLVTSTLMTENITINNLKQALSDREQALENLISPLFNNDHKNYSQLRSLLAAAESALPQPYVANDPLVRNGSQWFQKRVKADLSWLVSKGQIPTSEFQIQI